MAADPHIRGYYLSADVAHDFGNDLLEKSPYNTEDRMQIHDFQTRQK